MMNVKFKNGEMEVTLLAMYGEHALFVKKNGEHVVAWQPTFNWELMKVSWSGGTYLGMDIESAVEVWKEKIGFTPVLVQFGKVVFPTTITILKDDLAGYIEDALLQGNYWVGLDNDDKYKDTKAQLQRDGKNSDLGSVCAEVLMSYGKLLLYDIEDTDEAWTLSLKQFMVGIEREMIASNCSLEDISWDAVLQRALFNDIVYG